MKRWMFALTLSLGTALFCGPVLPGSAQYATDDAWRDFMKGRELLESGESRSAVLELWKEGRRKNPDHGLASTVKACIPSLELQVQADSKPAQQKVTSPAQLPLSERIDYYIQHFEEVHGTQMSNPGTCNTVDLAFRFRDIAPSFPSMGSSGTQLSDAIVRIGRPAMPALIQHLNDTRLTRSVAHRNGYWYVLRVQDVAIECIDYITHCPFFVERASVDYFSMHPAQEIQQTTQEIADWWKRNGNRSLLAGYLDRLNFLKAHSDRKDSLYESLDVIERIERLDPHAINAVALLKSWNPNDTDIQPAIEQEVRKRGDRSLLPQARQRLQQEPKRLSLDELRVLLRYGSDSDYARIGARVHQEIEAAGDSIGRLGTAMQVLDLAGGTVSDDFYRIGDPRLIPMLVEFLKYRAPVSRTIAEENRDTDLPLADEAMQCLTFLTQYNTGYSVYEAAPTRFAAVDRWLQWWKKEGSHRTFPRRPLFQ